MTRPSCVPSSALLPRRGLPLGGDLVVAKLVRVAYDLAIIDHEHGRKRHTGPDLTSEGVDGQDVVYRRLLLPATAAHDRVHRRTLSLLVRAHRADPRLRIEDTNGGLASLAPGTLATQPWIRPVRWVFRLSDPGGRGCLRRRLPCGFRGHVRRARLPGGGPPPAPPAERLRRTSLRLLAAPGTVAGRLG